jgi:adenylate cyclase
MQFWESADCANTMVQLFRTRMSAFFESRLKKPKLSTIISVLFVCLSIPILIFILAYTYYKTSQTIISTLQDEVARTRQASIENVEDMLQGVAGTLRMLSQMAADDPGFFRTEASRDVLYRAVMSAAEIDAAYVSFEDGYHRVVTRIDADRRRSDPKIPATARWHSSFIDEFSAAENRRRHRTFFDSWGHIVGAYDVATTMDIRTLPGYAAAKQSRGVIVTDPSINPDTGYPVIFVRAPIIRAGEFIGCASANLTLDVLSQFLATHRASRNSMTIIAERNDGRIVAASEPNKGVRIVDGHLQIARLGNFADEDVRQAYQLQKESKENDIVFTSRQNGQEISASFSPFPDRFGHQWEAIILTPTDDFIGQLRATNRQIVVVIVFLMAIELLLIYFLSRRLSKPIENISLNLKSIESLSFEHQTNSPSNVREIAQLQSAVSLLRNSLQSFSSFAPVGLVKSLIKSGIPLTLGVEKQFLTIFFSDVENFSTQAEQLPPDDLLARVSVYFEEVSRAISDEQGTVDKFIGDGVMAFWGAPLPLTDGVLHACRGALRAARRMERTNEAWRGEGRAPFRIRIGLNSADVLVGNVGSSERFSYTVMGDGVNVASRLEDINKTFGTTICISDSVFDAVGSKIVARPLRRVQVKGRKQAFMVYELVGIAGSDDPELAPRPAEKKLCEMTVNCSECFENGDLVEAARGYEEILKVFPNDPVAKSMLAASSARTQSVEHDHVTVES